MRYRQSGVTDYTVIELDASSYGYNITGLYPFTDYVLQVEYIIGIIYDQMHSDVMNAFLCESWQIHPPHESMLY